MQSRRPFLKWAGAKTKLLYAIRATMPRGARRFIEPFVGSGTVALNLDVDHNLLADTNRDLIGVYESLQREGEAFIDSCAPLFSEENNSAAIFYTLRAEFNASTDYRRKAALFVFLNRHGYNGLCRYNTHGLLNVPFGRHEHPRFPRERMRLFHVFLQHCELRHADFRAVMAAAGADDFIYCDPPYVPVSDTANFTTYAQAGFTAQDQADLADCSRAAAARGACVTISNHDTPRTRELYHGADEWHELAVPRRISCHTAHRTIARELLVVFHPHVFSSGPAHPTAA